MRLVVVDGLDGVGKDTHARLIKERYERMGERVIIRSHPESDNFFGVRSKKALLGGGRVNRLKASVFYALDVLRSLRIYYHGCRCDTLIMVRYLVGTAYLPRFLDRLAYWVLERFVPVSDYMFFLDASPEELLDRIGRREEREMFETYDALVETREKALRLVRGWYVINTARSIEETFAEIEDILDRIDAKQQK